MPYKVIEEWNLQITDRVDPKTAVKLGKLVGAKILVVGSIVKFGEASLRFIDVETGKAEAGENFTCRGEEDIPEMCNRIVGMLTGEMPDRLFVSSKKEFTNSM